jgi:hypothetical protein
VPGIIGVMPRLRQVALVARELEPVVEELQRALELGEPYRDPDIAVFGLRNAVFAVGDCFLEVVSPAQPQTAAGRQLDRLGGDGGYMALFQVDDFAAARARVTALGVRIAWEIDLGDIAGMHLHPRDVPGAIVSLDQPRPPEAWRWAGPQWSGGAPRHEPARIASLTVEVPDPAASRTRWASALGAEVPELTFAPGSRGITALTIERGGAEATYEICGVSISTRP